MLKHGSVEYLIFYNNHPIISVKLTLSSISSALLVWSVKQTSTKENSVLTVFILLKNVVKYLLADQIVYLEQN